MASLRWAWSTCSEHFQPAFDTHLDQPNIIHPVSGQPLGFWPGGGCQLNISAALQQRTCARGDPGAPYHIQSDFYDAGHCHQLLDRLRPFRKLRNLSLPSFSSFRILSITRINPTGRPSWLALRDWRANHPCHRLARKWRLRPSFTLNWLWHTLPAAFRVFTWHHARPLSPGTTHARPPSSSLGSSQCPAVRAGL